MISWVYRTLLLFAGFIIKSTCAISSPLVRQPIFTDFQPLSSHRVHDIHAGEGEERGERKEKEKPCSMKGTCPLLHIVLINSICLLTVINTPSLNTQARNSLIRCLWDRVPTTALPDNSQSLTDPCFDLQINPPIPTHSGFVHKPHNSLSYLHSYNSGSPQIKCFQHSYILRDGGTDKKAPTSLSELMGHLALVTGSGDTVWHRSWALLSLSPGSSPLLCALQVVYTTTEAPPGLQSICSSGDISRPAGKHPASEESFKEWIGHWKEELGSSPSSAVTLINTKAIFYPSHIFVQTFPQRLQDPCRWAPLSMR